ncbi:MAG TPA: NAD(P)/FAD-dependent oxidoreductase [Blastocatellia bacterium]|nr:NAD(P)/FAD-dependent oxidoreductase [Blastocatellia bacterium]
MTRRVAIIGAGMGGLAAALRLAQRGFRVSVFEARPGAGGLASGLDIDGLSFDAGPYILLDREGLDWAFEQLDLNLSESIPLKRIEQVYQVEVEKGQKLRILADLDQTAEGFENLWPGSGSRYRRFVQTAAAIHQRLRSMLYVSRPTPAMLVRSGAWRHLGFLLRSLESILRGARLPQPVVEALGIWTHVAGQSLDQAPSPLAFVPALIHTTGAFYPAEGIGAIPVVLERSARAAGVDFHYGVSVKRITCKDGRAHGIETSSGDYVAADAVLSNHSGIGTYLNLTDVPSGARGRLKRLPLQSPGVCAYLAVRERSKDMYLRFLLPGGGERCRLLVTPSAVATDGVREGWWPARLIAPMQYSIAERGPGAQREFLDRVLGEAWWREYVGEYKLLQTRIPTEWGSSYSLYRESMNPVMTARFMREGRLAHRSPWVKSLYLAGSSTHPGQWVSFCAISGILAAGKICEDFA